MTGVVICGARVGYWEGNLAVGALDWGGADIFESELDTAVVVPVVVEGVVGVEATDSVSARVICWCGMWARL